MSCQCAKCLGIVRECSHNGVTEFSCDTCEWLAPLEMCDFGMLCFPKTGNFEWAQSMWYRNMIHEAHQGPVINPTSEFDSYCTQTHECEQIKKHKEMLESLKM